MKIHSIPSANNQQVIHLVVLLHGIGKTDKSLKGLEHFLKTYGFDIINLHYPATQNTIEELVEIIHIKIGHIYNKYKFVSYVGFSFGGLVIRAYLEKYRMQNLGKVVLLGTPNNGTKIADFLQNNILYKKFLGPAGQQLVTDNSNITSILGKPYYECGIIAGDLPLDFCYPLMRSEPNDGKVSVSSAKLEGMTDHIVVNVTHWFMPRSKTVWKHILSFLNYAKFKK